MGFFEFFIFQLIIYSGGVNGLRVCVCALWTVDVIFCRPEGTADFRQGAGLDDQSCLLWGKIFASGLVLIAECCKEEAACLFAES